MNKRTARMMRAILESFKEQAPNAYYNDGPESEHITLDDRYDLKLLAEGVNKRMGKR